MAQATAIEWTDLSWNPTHGCSKVSPGCAHCYAETLSRRYNQTPKPWTPANAAENVILKPHKLREPLSGAKAWQGLGEAAARAGKTDGKLVFVNSMSDLFHEEIADNYIAQVFAVMSIATRHTFQVLTKRPERMRDLMRSNAFWLLVNQFRYEAGERILGFTFGTTILSNVWLGVSIENRRFVNRADLLRETPAAVRFISAEPLLGPLVPSGEIHTVSTVLPGDVEYCWRDGRRTKGRGLDLTDIDWLIVGGESGPDHRPIKAEWAGDLRDACLARCMGCYIAESARAEEEDEPYQGGCFEGRRPAFLFKQWGGSTPKSGGRVLDGRTWDEFPQVQEAADA